MKYGKMLRLLSAVLALAALIACAPVSALADGEFSAYVSSFSMSVYRDPYLGNLWGTLPQNTVVTVNAYAGGVAQITYKGRTGYASVDDMKKVEAVLAEKPEEDEEGTNATTTEKTRVYQAASLSSRHITVPKGIEVKILATMGNCARVERNGYIGYMYTEHLTTEKKTEELEKILSEEPAAEKPVKETVTLEQAAAAGKYSNEQLLYQFAIHTLGYNTAAACGLLSNCYYESTFSTACLSDGGSSYGLFQWHEVRWSRMRSWCSSNGFDYKTIVGQLNFLKYELEKYYPKVDRYMKSVPNTAQGAYDAAYYYCVNYLVPANKESQGAKRGSRAQSVYWEKYNGTAA